MIIAQLRTCRSTTQSTQTHTQSDAMMQGQRPSTRTLAQTTTPAAQGAAFDHHAHCHCLVSLCNPHLRSLHAITTLCMQTYIGLGRQLLLDADSTSTSTRRRRAHAGGIYVTVARRAYAHQTRRALHIHTHRATRLHRTVVGTTIHLRSHLHRYCREASRARVDARTHAPCGRVPKMVVPRRKPSP